MSFFKNLRNKHTVTTLYKYFISYFLLLTILTLGYTVAFRVQLKKVYTKELHNQAEKQLTDIDNDLYSSISLRSRKSNIFWPRIFLWRCPVI